MTGLAPAATRLGDGRRRFQHGPIDLLLEAEGEHDAVERALDACWERFQPVLTALAAELATLRQPATARAALHGPVARRMARACAPFAAERFITPMAAVAGAVADELIPTFRRAGVRRAFINNGGDIALHLTPGATYRVGIGSSVTLMPTADGVGCALEGSFLIRAAMPVRGLATSGWRGRSFSLGIADSVTVLAATAAAADAAATLIGNAVDCDAPGIVRTPASQVKDDTDLGDRLVTVDVPRLPGAVIALALARGRLEAERWHARGLIHAAVLRLQGAVAVIDARARAARGVA